jgi:exodeoxyribonuclease VII large subunit
VTLSLPLEGAGPSGERPWSVSDLVERLRAVLETHAPAVWVEGEVSSFKSYESGHWYFTLRDRREQVRAVVWRSVAQRLPAEPAEGLKVFAYGRARIGRKGDLQFEVERLLPTAEGGWHAILLERARAALERDGLLDPARKRPLPAFPTTIGVVTSPEGAAWHDVVAVVRRRWPLCRLVLIGARVQGEEAPRDLVRALALAARAGDLDVLIVGRGGGAREDLAAFNDERVARAVAACPVPTIAAVGHEIDVTLTDLVADVRAATPSAAAEKAVPDRREVAQHVAHLERQIVQLAARRLEGADARVRAQAARLEAAVTGRVRRTAEALGAAALRMRAATDRRVAALSAEVTRVGAQLDALSPLKVLDRGYAVARAADGRVLRRTADFRPGLAFRLRVADGEVPSRVEGQR